jgi:hypothetical protein
MSSSDHFTEEKGRCFGVKDNPNVIFSTVDIFCRKDSK